MSAKPIITILPDMDTPDLRETLEEAGYVVIATDTPDAIQAIEALSVASLGIVHKAALLTIYHDCSMPEQAHFGRRVAKDLADLASRAPTHGGDDV